MQTGITTRIPESSADTFSVSSKTGPQPSLRLPATTFTGTFFTSEYSSTLDLFTTKPEFASIALSQINKSKKFLVRVWNFLTTRLYFIVPSRKKKINFYWYVKFAKVKIEISFNISRCKILWGIPNFTRFM